MRSKVILAPLIAVYFLLSSTYSIWNTFVTQTEFNFLVLETYIYHALAIVASVLLLLKIKYSGHLYAFLFITHLLYRAYYTPQFDLGIISYLLLHIAIDSLILFYLYNLNAKNYYKNT